MAKKDEIILHPTKGLNPHQAFCPRCGGDSPSLVLIGNRDYVTKCGKCGCEGFGMSEGTECPKCGGTFQNRRPLEDNEKVPGDLCDSCRNEEEKFEKIVSEGGIYWRCTQCHKHGVLYKHSGLAKAVREQMNIPAPDPCGVEFQKCEEHTVQPSKDDTNDGSNPASMPTEGNS